MSTSVDTLADLDEFQRALAVVKKFEPINNNSPEWNFSDHIQITVYRTNGRFDNMLTLRMVYRRPVLRGGRWHIRDHGLVPLRGTIDDGCGGRAYVT